MCGLCWGICGVLEVKVCGVFVALSVVYCVDLWCVCGVFLGMFVAYL